MRWFGLRAWGCVCVAALLICWSHPTAWSYYLDSDGTMKLGVRAYVNARIGTQKNSKTIFNRLQFDPGSNGQPADPTTLSPSDITQYGQTITLESKTFPDSPAGHLRQNRFFIEAELNHDVTKLMKDGFGPLAILNHLPFKVSDLSYHLTYRGEADGVYTWGPKEFSTSEAYQELLDNNPFDNNTRPPDSCTLQSCPDIPQARKVLRERGLVRNRLFQASVE